MFRTMNCSSQSNPSSLWSYVFQLNLIMHCAPQLQDEERRRKQQLEEIRKREAEERAKQEEERRWREEERARREADEKVLRSKRTSDN